MSPHNKLRRNWSLLPRQLPLPLHRSTVSILPTAAGPAFFDDEVRRGCEKHELNCRN